MYIHFIIRYLVDFIYGPSLVQSALEVTHPSIHVYTHILFTIASWNVCKYFKYLASVYIHFIMRYLVDFIYHLSSTSTMYIVLL